VKNLEKTPKGVWGKTGANWEIIKKKKKRIKSGKIRRNSEFKNENGKWKMKK
jgi:hypothetical protein